MNSKGFRFPILSLTVVLAVLIAGCNDPEIDSRWRDREITVDGDDSEWGNYIQHYDEETRIVFCMFNDDSDLYIKLSSPNRTIQSQIIGLGLTVWFDPEGGNDKKFGIHFPIGMQGASMKMMGRREKPAGAEDTDQIQKKLEAAQQEIELIGPGINERYTMPVEDAALAGIYVRIGKPRGNIIYELKVPLAFSDDHPYAIGTTADKKIGVGFETGKMNKEMMAERRSKSGGGKGGRDGGRGGISGGMGGRMGGRTGGRGGMPGRERGLMPEPLDLWTKVTLASGPNIQ